MDSSIDSSADMNFSDIDDCLDLTDTTLECDRSVVQTNNDATGSDDELDPDVIVIRDEPPDDAAAENSVELLEDYEEEADEEVGLTLLSGRSKKGKALMRGKTKVKATDKCCEGHLVCNDCVKRTTKDVLMGKMQGSVSCPKPDCSSSVPMSELRKVHESLIIELLEDKWQKDTLDALEKMSDVIKCPGCGLSQVLDVEVKQYKCAGCSKSYCRHCNREWGDRSHDLCISTKKWESSFSGKVINIPAYWCDPPLNQLMYKNMHCNVVRIYRVQNHKMWEKYSVTRSHMIEDLGERTTNETRLYHGTDIQTIGAICEEGFDLRMSGKNACLFGDGVYFANSAAFSHKYAAMGRSRSKSQAIGSAAGFQSIAHTSPGIHLSSTVKPVNPVPTTQITFTQAYPLGIPFSTTGAHSLSAFNPQGD
ncbi:PARPT-like protein [Mya arenaria]|uniref:Poly [ADP-ribose] polymerase n=1 Tax=Mya arenaria TaxID=6604 RepID=A0ABY7E2M8_MYAAR|nr:PARPT-like protein [Mya arenaria]